MRVKVAMVPGSHPPRGHEAGRAAGTDAVSPPTLSLFPPREGQPLLLTHTGKALESNSVERVSLWPPRSLVFNTARSGQSAITSQVDSP